MDYYLFIARSITQAQHMAHVLANCGIRAAVLRTPASLSERGCSHAVKIRADKLSAARLCLDRAQLQPLHIYYQDANGYNEVSV